jgi:hypothetical protein
MDPIENISSAISCQGTGTLQPWAQSCGFEMIAATSPDARPLLPLCLNKEAVFGSNTDAVSDQVLEKYSVLFCPYCPLPGYSYCNHCFLVSNMDLEKTLPTEKYHGRTFVRMDLSWWTHYQGTSSTCKLYHAVNNHAIQVHHQSLPPLALTQVKGSIPMVCPYITGNACENCDCTCNGVLFMPGSLKPAFYARYLNARRNLPYNCSFVEFNMLDDDYKGQSKTEKLASQRATIAIWLLHLSNCHTQCEVCSTTEQLLLNRNAITERRRLYASDAPTPTNDSYGQPLQHPTVDATAEWEESAETEPDLNLDDYENVDEEAIVDL